MTQEKCVFLAIARTVEHEVLSVHWAGTDSRVEPTDKPSYAEASALRKVLRFLGTIFMELLW